jgi:hypothetical protein
VKGVRLVAAVMLLVGFAIGTALDRVPTRAPIVLGGYQVLAADFHTHSSMWSDGATTPWGLVLEAKRQGLDAIAITGHNQTLDAKWGRWFADVFGGVTVLVGEEIPTVRHHLVAVGIDRTVDWRLDLLSQIEDIHQQGGVAIAVHPGLRYWSGFEPAMQQLDGAEVCHPAIFTVDEAQSVFERFAARGPVAAIGSSDFHGFGRMGVCRTFVFATDNTAEAILDALRGRRTVVYGRPGKVYGDPELVQLAEADGRLAAAARTEYPLGRLDRLGQVAGLIGLGGVVFGERRRRQTRH